MAQLLPPVPKEPIEPDSRIWREWFNKVRNVIVGTAQGVISWASLNFDGSNITDIVTRNHNDLQTIQGGTANQYYHLTATQLTNLGTVTTVSVATSNGFAGTVATATSTPVITLSTSVTGLLKGNGTAISAATSGTDYAPATSGTSILYGNGSGGFSNVTIGTGVSFATGTLSATGSGGTITSVTGTAPVASSGGTTPVISMAAATTSVDGYLTSTDWTTFNNKGSGTVTSVTGSAPVVSSGGTTPAISMAAATTSVSGYLTSTDWTTFNNKGSGTVTSVSGTAGQVSSTGGTTPVIDLVSGIASAGTTGSASLIPVVTIDTYGRVTSITTAANPQGTVTSVGWTGGIVSVATATTTPAFTVAGTSGGVPYFSSTSTWATSAALVASAIVIGGGAGAAPSTTTTGTGVVTALGVNTGSAGAFVVNGGALGSPSSAGTIPAFTLGGTVAGGGNQLNNVIIGTTTPLAGAFTTLSATGTITSTNSGLLFNRTGGTTIQQYLRFANTDGDLYLGVSNNTGTAFATGETAYAVVLMSAGPKPLQLASNGIVTLTSNAAGTGISIPGTLAAGATTITGTLTTTSYVTVNSANASFAWNWSGVEMISTNGNNNTGTAANAAVTIFRVRADNITGRSISAGGTVNASGADYAEYMTKAGDFAIAKGDVIGIDAQGKLTNVFLDAVSFVVKSTNPSYVGGDSWGDEDAVGKIPTKPVQLAATDDVEAETDEAFAVRMSQYETDKTAFEDALEAARQKVDRIAFAGQVPVNVTGATAGQYIIPINDNGAIKGEAVSKPTFEQYQISVGKVIAIDADGRAKIIVKVA